MAQLGLYNVQSPLTSAQNFMGQASGSYGSMDRKRPTPGPTLGGGVQSAAGGAMTGAAVGSLFADAGASGIAAVGGPWALGIGAGLGALSYFLS